MSRTIPFLVCAALASCGGGGGRGPAAVVACGGAVAPALDVVGLTAEPGPAPGTVVLRFPAPPSRGAAVSRYVVRSSPRHLTAENVSQAAVVAQGHVPQPPGTPEAILLAGLEPGRTLQFSVQAVRGGAVGPFSYGVASRVTAGPEALPAKVIPVAMTGTLTTTNATYLLTEDVTATGTAFRVAAQGVTLDLGGHTVTYGTSGEDGVHGVLAEFLSGAATVTVRNGRIVQAGGGAECHGVHARECHHVTVENVAVEVSGPDSHGIDVDGPTGDVRITRCDVACKTTVVSNRHFPGVAAIRVEGALGSCEVDQNRVTASPQWGIKVQGRETTGACSVHHNVVVGTKALVANAYMVGVHKPSCDVYENFLASESRGVHLDGVDHFGRDADVHDNAVRVQDQPNPEYPDFHWAHGVKVEGAPRARVRRNLIVGVADDAHGEVRALDLALFGATGVEVCQNRVRAVATGRHRGHALQWSAGAAAAPNDVVVRHNVFEATDRVVHRDWGAGLGGVLAGNVFLRDQPASGREFDVEFFETSDEAPSPGHRLRDTLGGLALDDVSQWASPAPYESAREWTVTVVVVGAGGRPERRATVTLADATGGVEFTGSTDESGRASGVAVGAVVTNGPTVTARTPHRLTVERLGTKAFEGTLVVDGPTAVRVDVEKGVLLADAAPPDAPGGVAGHPLSASRALVRWERASDDLGVSAYVVTLDGVVVGTTDGTSIVVAGLEPETDYVPAVQAVDEDGRVSPFAAGAPFTTRPEDRGP
jgi:hypothetical protein